MNPLRFLSLFTLAFLTACAATPEQLAARAQARKQEEQNLQIHLASQCDPETARLIQKQFELADNRSVQTVEQQKSFRLKYIDKVSDPMFQACYKMAWQNYISQQQLQEARYYYNYYEPLGLPFLPSAVFGGNDDTGRLKTYSDTCGLYKHQERLQYPSVYEPHK